MGLPLSCQRTMKVKSDSTQRKLQQSDITSFYDELRSNPVFNGRFKNVPLLRILSMGNEILFCLRNSSSEESFKSFEEIFDMHALMYISEAEIDAFFYLFIEHCHIESENCWDSFEPIFDDIKNRILDREKQTLLKFFTEIKRNPILDNKFKTTSVYCLGKIKDEIFGFLEGRIPDTKLEYLQNTHLMMNISVQEYDEFVDLFFEIYCPDVNYRTRAGPIFLKIKDVMVGIPLQRNLNFRKALEEPIGGRKFNIPEKKLRKMCSQMVDMVLHPKDHDLNSIAVSHGYFKITGAEFDELIRRFLQSYNLNDTFVLMAKPTFSKLREMICGKHSGNISL